MPDFSNLSQPVYTISTDLGGQDINLKQLQDEINADGTINATRTCDRIRAKTGADEIIFIFDADLTNPAQTDALTVVVAAYSYVARVQAPLKNETATTVPTVSDDSTKGYGKGSGWTNIGSGDQYGCKSASVGAADWKMLYSDPSDFTISSITGYVANEHVDHSTVSVTAGVGLSGGGTIAATRTVDLDINGLAADATPDGAADYVVTYDASATGHKKVLLNNLPGSGGGSTTDLPAVQIRRTTTYSTTTGYVALTMDTKDLENNNTVVKHDGTTTSRIEILTTGLYEIYYRLISQPDTATTTFSSRVFKNGTTLVPGSESIEIGDVPNGTYSPINLSRNVVTSLTTADYVEVQIKTSTAGYTVNSNAIFSVRKLEGIQGATGVGGSDGDVTWQGAWSGATNYTINQVVTYGGSSYVCITNHINQIPPNATYWDVMAAKGDTPIGVADIIVPIFTHSAHEKSVLGATWDKAGHFIFRGSTVLGTPAAIKASVRVTAGSGGGVRIYDLTNSLPIASVTTLSNTTHQIISLGTISNVPTGEAIFEVQWHGDGTNTTYLSGITIQF